MSVNRSVQAAQRRRTSQPESVPGRSPQPSINSAQLFANQSRSGQGPNIPSGRLAGQQAALQQQQHQQKPEGLSGISKMTVPQAITLITLRLGAVETKIMNIEQNPTSQSQSISIEGQDNMVLVDNNVIQSITSRLESLEKRSGASSTSGPEVSLLKQQFETVKQALVQTKGATATILKDNKDLKTQVENLKNELLETKELLNVLQNLSMDNSQKLMELSITVPGEFNNETYINEDISEHIDYETIIRQSGIETFGENEDNDQNEIVGTNLKELIESEINANI